MRYNYKNSDVDARQFDGTNESADKLIEWAESKGCQAWTDHGIIPGDPAQGLSTMGVVVDMDVSPEGGQFNRTMQVVVGHDDWLVWDQDHFRSYGNYQFGIHFSKPASKSTVSKTSTK